MTDCLFCRIVGGEVPATVVHETDHTIGFRDINPQAPTHVLVIPREHVADLTELSQRPDLLQAVTSAAADVAAQEGLTRGWRFVFNTGPDAGQSVFHVHGHVLGGRGLGWPPG